MKVAIIGAGAIGQAVKNLIDPGKIAVLEIWDKKDQTGRGINDVVNNADLIFLCIPSYALRDVLGKISDSVNEGALFVSLSKGIEETTGLLVPQVLSEFLDENQFGLLSGPMIAEEIMSKQGAIGVVASLNENLIGVLNDIFVPNCIRLEYIQDLYSISLCGVMKNIYTVVVGIGFGLNYDRNVIGWLISRSLQEQLAIAERFNADPNLFIGSAGLGDFVATAMSGHSFNREMGIKIAQGQKTLQSEGLIALGHLMDKLPVGEMDLPVLSALCSIVYEGEDPQMTFAKLIYG